MISRSLRQFLQERHPLLCARRQTKGSQIWGFLRCHRMCDGVIHSSHEQVNSRWIRTSDFRTSGTSTKQMNRKITAKLASGQHRARVCLPMNTKLECFKEDEQVGMKQSHGERCELPLGILHCVLTWAKSSDLLQIFGKKQCNKTIPAELKIKWCHISPFQLRRTNWCCEANRSAKTLLSTLNAQVIRCGEKEMSWSEMAVCGVSKISWRWWKVKKRVTGRRALLVVVVLITSVAMTVASSHSYWSPQRRHSTRQTSSVQNSGMIQLSCTTNETWLLYQRHGRMGRGSVQLPLQSYFGQIAWKHLLEPHKRHRIRQSVHCFAENVLMRTITFKMRTEQEPPNHENENTTKINNGHCKSRLT